MCGARTSARSSAPSTPGFCQPARDRSFRAVRATSGRLRRCVTRISPRSPRCSAPRAACSRSCPARAVALYAGLGLLAAAEIGLGVALVPGHDLARLKTPLHVAAIVVAALAVVAVAALFVRWPGPRAARRAHRGPVPAPDRSGQPARQVPAPAAVRRPGRGRARARLPHCPQRDGPGRCRRCSPFPSPRSWPSTPSRSSGRRTSSRAASSSCSSSSRSPLLVTVVARSPFPDWLPRAAAVRPLVALGCVFAAIGIYQAWTNTLIYAQDLRVANAYTTYFRVTSLFKDPSIYGRQLVAGDHRSCSRSCGRGSCASVWAALLIAAALRRPLLLVLAVEHGRALRRGARRHDRARRPAEPQRRRRRRLVAALAAAAGFVGEREGQLAGTGDERALAADQRDRDGDPQPPARRRRRRLPAVREPAARRGRSSVARKDASHTTPLTVSPSSASVGFLLYLGLLASAAVLLRRVVRARDRLLGICLAAVFLVLVLHSFFYSGFFEDPLTWGVLAFAAASLAAPGRRATGGSGAATGSSSRRETTGQLGAAAEVDRPAGEHLRAARRRVVRHLGRLARPERVADPRQHGGARRRGRRALVDLDAVVAERVAVVQPGARGRATARGRRP